MTHFQDSEEHTSMLILLFLFLTILILAVYSNIRLFVILCRNFPRERTHSYFPMLLLLNTLSSMTVIILVCSMLLPFVPHGVDGKIDSAYDVIVYPAVYALITPTLIAAADLILCVQRVAVSRKLGETKVSKRWYGVLTFLIVAGPIAYISYNSRIYSFTIENKRNAKQFVCFLADSIIKGVCGVLSFIGYLSIWIWAKKQKNFDTIIRQALPIATFQVLIMTIQFLLELPNVPKIDPRERIFLDVCFSAAASVVVPLCTMIGESRKRDMFYSSFCYCYCYCEPRPPPPSSRHLPEASSKADRQKIEEEEARKRKKNEELKRRRREARSDRNFDSLESQESEV
ncbi:G_PROTEIN_RECEP_F1_2 domain-containing protein [Caenorhabditis elegans]|uniref:G_PROTEIN_RECEP_F1_2 domain-containing protein n=1 Tax=Caenorhabditis elegans TaxID=6239 RepID=Q9XWM4_CAEEL|nr:G_PROTEIN_RECEP_F1_2 domain-containing protein [Caenorhabditis elegans]CAA21629.1 G_PROTEIN_RECEP_F1_2 domain-containing protein [Caenorhabditis elegans]|eukprot:NP_496762.1 Uncharacterized protein CELE_Y38F1A.4 [Caenorhabditis elegans]